MSNSESQVSSIPSKEYYKEEFLNFWGEFIIQVKGKLLTCFSRQNLMLSIVNLTLAEAATTWGSDLTLPGRWLASLRQDYPEQGALVWDVLLKDLTFTEELKDGAPPAWIETAVPAAGALVGFVGTAAFGLPLLYKAAALIVPAALLYPITKGYRSARVQIGKEKVIEGYLAQLDKYEKSIVAILS